MNKHTIQECLSRLDRKGIDYIFVGDSSLLLNWPVQINKLGNSTFSYYTGESVNNIKSEINDKNLVILKNELKDSNQKQGNFIYTFNPQLGFTVIAELFKEKLVPGIHKTAFIEYGAVIGENCFIGAFSFIGKDVIIGNNVIIEEGCVVKNKVVIKDKVIIRSGVKLGNPGMGSIKDNKGRFHDFVHFGDIIIENDVVIADNTVINQGTLNTTTIMEGTRIGPNNCIAHGVTIGKFCFISQGINIAGSCIINDNCWIAPGAVIRDGVIIGNNVTIGMGAVVTKDIPENECWIGIPAKKLRNQ